MSSSIQGIVELAGNDYVLALWFVGAHAGNAMAVAFRKEGDTDFQLVVRLRTFEGETRNPFLTGDRKSVFTIDVAGMTEGEVVATGDAAARGAADTFDRPHSAVECILVRGGVKKFSKMLAKSGIASRYQPPAKA